MSLSQSLCVKEGVRPWPASELLFVVCVCVCCCRSDDGDGVAHELWPAAVRVARGPPHLSGTHARPANVYRQPQPDGTLHLRVGAGI